MIKAVLRRAAVVLALVAILALVLPLAAHASSTIIPVSTASVKTRAEGGQETRLFSKAWFLFLSLSSAGPVPNDQNRTEIRQRPRTVL